MGNYSKARQATVDNMTRAHFMLGMYGYKHILGCNTDCFLLQRWLLVCAALLCYMYVIPQ